MTETLLKITLSTKQTKQANQVKSAERSDFAKALQFLVFVCMIVHEVIKMSFCDVSECPTVVIVVLNFT